MKDFARIAVLLLIAGSPGGCGGGDSAANASPNADAALAVVAACELDASSWDESVWL